MTQVGRSSGGGGGSSFAHGLALELDAVGVVDEAVEDGVGEGRLADERG
jgi:hypothetical protein